MFRSISLRVAALYTGLFVLAVAGLGAVTLFTTRDALSRQFDVRITVEAGALQQEYRTEGMEDVIDAVREHEATPGALEYGLKDPAGHPIAGRLAGLTASPGWSVARVAGGRGRVEPIRVLATALPNGDTLLIGDTVGQIEALDGAVLRGFAVVLLGVVLMGVAAGYALSRDLNRRFAAISGVAEAIIDGDLARRVPLRGAGDDLDRLAATFNRMLDRIGTLMESLQQVSSDIAHDLRTPLTRLRQRLEAGLATAEPDACRAAVETALADLEAILETFSGLLRIAEIEGGRRRAAFRRLDLTAAAALVVESFSPSAEEAGRTLSLIAKKPVWIEGDAELLTQLMVNLVENGLRHTPPGATVRVAVGEDAAGAWLRVADDGPGVPVAERKRLFDRFYRLERSRSTPGSGLGLALVAAVAKLHRAEAALDDAKPGLEARVTFPRA